MRYLGIDYGRKKIGLAIAQAGFAEPYKVIRVSNFNDAVKKVLQVIQVLQVEKVVVGVSEGIMAEESKRFGEVLKISKNVLVDYFDETLTSQDAISLSIQGGIKRKKRKNMEDAYAAAIMLQNYLDKTC